MPQQNAGQTGFAGRAHQSLQVEPDGDRVVRTTFRFGGGIATEVGRHDLVACVGKGRTEQVKRGRVVGEAVSRQDRGPHRAVGAPTMDGEPISLHLNELDRRQLHGVTPQ